MTTARRSLRFTLATATCVLASCLVGLARQQPSTDPSAAATAPLAQTLPVDPRITTGQLSNGLRYYVRANKKPDDRAELRLVVKAGSVLESDDQRGLAHFVEHMAFNGTTDFPKQSIVNFIESIGMRFGSDLNASTSYDQTVYMLQVPTDNAAVMDKAIAVLENWAHKVTFESDEIDKERGVIIEEWRLGRGADGRIRDKQMPVLFEGSRYADRSPIGTLDVLQNFKHDRLTQFYKDWYRPELMAVMAVGDFDPAAVAAMIKTHFNSIPASVSPKPRPTFTIPAHPGTHYAITTDPEAPGSNVVVYNVIPARDQSTIGAYRQQQILDHLFEGMLNARFAELTQQPKPPFLFAQADIGQMVRSADVTSLVAVVKDGAVGPGLESLFVEAQRVAKFGFTQTEFDRQKLQMLRGIERAMAEYDNQQSSSLAAEYIRNFLTDEPIPGLAYEDVLYRRFLNDIKLSEVNALASKWSPDNNRTVMVTAPEKAGVPVPTPGQLASVMASAATKPITAYVDSATTKPLLAATATPGTVVSTALKPALGMTEWKLSNGATVVLKPTTFKQDEILMQAFAPGGTSLASDADFISADNAAGVVGIGGLGTFNLVDLSKNLAGKAARVDASIGDYTQGLSGQASPKDIETLFQLIYLRMTAPRAADPSLFATALDQWRTSLANQDTQPEAVYDRALTAAVWKNNPRAMPMTLADVDKINLNTAMAFYKERFADVSGFTFVFVGNIDPVTIKPYVEKYIASLPSTHRNAAWKDVGLRRATGVVEKTVTKGIEPQSETTLLFSGPFPFDQAHRVTIRAMAMVLDGLLRESLREDLGGTYSVNVTANYEKIPVPAYTIRIAFGSAPTRVDELVRTVFAKIDQLKRNGPIPGDVESIRNIFLRDLESNTKQNAFYLREIGARYQNGESLDDLANLSAFYNDNINPTAVQDAAKTYFNLNNYVKVTLVPEK